MKLKDLYGQLPPERHSDIAIAGQRIFVGGVETYLQQPNGDLYPVQPATQTKIDDLVSRITRLETALTGIKASVDKLSDAAAK